MVTSDSVANPHGAEAERRVDLLLKWGRPVLDAQHEDLGPFTQRRSCRWVSLTSYLPVGNARKSTAISLIDTNKDTRPKATPIKRFWSGTVKCHTPCSQTSTLRRRKRR